MTRSGNKPDPFLGWGLALSALMFVLYVYPGFFTPVTPHFDGTCRAVTLGASAEDIRIDYATGLAYMTYLDRSRREARQRPPGTVMVIDLNAPEPRARAALTSTPERFYPKGMSLYAPEDGPKRLFVVSRTQLGRHSIEIFEQGSTGAFAHVETIRNRLLWSPNGIVAVGPRQFYVTNDAGFKEREADDPRNFAPGRLRQNRANVLYFDGDRMKHVARRLNTANGIAVSRDGHHVYVSETSAQRLRIFERNLATGALVSRETVPLDGSPNNISVDPDGEIWVATHSRFSGALARLEDPEYRSPTRVVKVTPAARGDDRVREIYVNDGKELSGGTGAGALNDLLVIGAYAERKLLLCTQASAATPRDYGGPEKET